jgi:hypothetical protein
LKSAEKNKNMSNMEIFFEEKSKNILVYNTIKNRDRKNRGKNFENYF